MPDRFANGDETSDPKGADDWNNDPMKASLFGGDLQGIIDHLDHLQKLGFNGLYLTPVFSAYSGHKFDTIDFFQVDKNFGTKETLKKLVEAVIKRIKDDMKPGYMVNLNLNSAKGKENFYAKLGFVERPNEDAGAGMNQWLILDD